jgi:hypothetical protein
MQLKFFIDKVFREGLPRRIIEDFGGFCHRLLLYVWSTFLM